MSSGNQLTPMMKQYAELKRQNKETLLFFRLGDFYEMFFDDARLAASVLGLTLTSRNKVPMAGVPYHAVESYISRLIRAGHKVTICEQTEDPRKAKGLVKREIIRTITPGTALNPSLLEEKAHNYLASINKNGTQIGLSFIDPSTGEFKAADLADPTELLSELNRISPRECLLPDSLRDWELIESFPEQATLTWQDDWLFDSSGGYKSLCELFQTYSLDGFGCQDLRTAIGAAGAIISYLKETQRSDLTHITRLTPYSTSDFMVLDPATWRNLELTQTMRTGERTGTLIWVLDKTVTAMGGRLLRSWLQHPLIKVKEITYRQEGIAELVESLTLRENIAADLDQVHDIQRLISRLDAGLANARDLVDLKESLKLIPDLKKKLTSLKAKIWQDIEADLDELPDVVGLIEEAITPSPPLSLKEGGLIKTGYHQELDDLRRITKSGKSWIAELQQKEIQRTGIKSMKVGYNKVFGYYIEVTRPNLHLVPEDYIRKQTIANGERFITPELKERELQVLSAQEKIIELEYELFLQIRARIIKEAGRIQQVGRALALLDVLNALARVAAENDYVRPELNEGQQIIITEGRHPVVEHILTGERFVPNDTLLGADSDQLLVITGPNMAGKSTYIRQVALIVLMAQIGGFVPASSATIGVVDRIFTRVGASDELMKGQSTFMVEMIETANILNNATPRSLIVLDEIGRGTSTFDGVSIAWAVAEYIHNHPQLRARALFATHYHELTELEDYLERVRNYNIAVSEQDGQVVFLRKIVKGGTDRSYGIHVAQLAGLPAQVISRASEILEKLEQEAASEGMRSVFTTRHSGYPQSGCASRPQKGGPTQLELFTFEPHPVVEKIRQLDLNNLTPLQALNKLQELKTSV
ncbi:MAG: DNA mismatch repair protein MutS [bacterium]